MKSPQEAWNLNQPVLVLVVSGLFASGCATTTQTGALVGGLGAGLLSGSVGGAVGGAAVGAGIGYLTEQERQNAETAAGQEDAAVAQASVSQETTAYRPENANPFVGSTWRVISVEGYPAFADANQVMITFQTNSKVTTMVARDGSSEAFVESYGIVDDVIVFSGREDGQDYSVAVRFSQNGRLMTLSLEEARLVMEEIEESVE